MMNTPNADMSRSSTGSTTTVQSKASENNPFKKPYAPPTVCLLLSDKTSGGAGIGTESVVPTVSRGPS